VPVVGNVDLRLYGLVVRHGLWEEGRKEGFWEKWGASKIKVVIKKLGTGQGVMYTSQVVKIGCLKVKFECLKVKFEWLKGQRSVQHPKNIRVNGCTPWECTLACKARGYW